VSNVIKLLIIEDEPVQVQNYKDEIDDFNVVHNNDVVIKCDSVENSGDAITELTKNEYDAVIVDLILKGDVPGQGRMSGNNVLDYIFTDNGPRLMVYVVSGTLAELSEEHNDVLDNPLLEQFERTGETSDVLNHINSVYKTGVINMLGNKGMLNNMINDVFFKHLPVSFNSWLSVESNCEKEFLRYTLLHLMEYLDLPEGEGEAESKYHAAEFYITPPIRSNIASGDIFEYDNKKYYLLSPSCDVAPRLKDGNQVFNVESLTVAQIRPLDKHHFDVNNIKYANNGSTSQGNWNKFSTSQRKSNQKNRFHYIPKCIDIDESAIDFKAITTLSLVDYQDSTKTKRIATVSSPFKRDIQGRFSAYFGRQGQPNGLWSA